MKHQFKNQINSLALIFPMLATLFVLGCGCNTSKPALDPLAGWQIAYGEDPDKTIEKDYQQYIQELPPDQKGPVGTIWFYKNNTGQHAVHIEIFEGNKNASWQHALFYDKDDRRTNVIRYGHIKYES